jgi:hypothetical protein
MAKTVIVKVAVKTLVLLLCTCFFAVEAFANTASIDVQVSVGSSWDEVKLLVQVTGVNPAVASYSLDGCANVTFSGAAVGLPIYEKALVTSVNTIILPDLPGGLHNLTFYVIDGAQDAAVKTVVFSTGNTSPPQTLSPEPTLATQTFLAPQTKQPNVTVSYSNYVFLIALTAAIVGLALVASILLLCRVKRKSLGAL